MSKKLISLIIFLVVFSSVVFAEGVITKGIKAGINFATLTGDDVEDYKSKTGFIVGGFLTYKVNETFAIQPEILFTMKGGKFEENIEDINMKLTDKINYLEIPVLAKLYIPTTGNIKPNLFAGPALAFNLSATYKFESNYFEDDEGDIDEVKPIDFGLIFGAGLDINKVSIDARYNMGLTSIDDSGEDFDVKNSVFSIMLGYSF